MFISLGLFKGIACPKRTECELTNCIFTHEIARDPASNISGAKIYDPFENIEEILSPPTKRRRIKSPEKVLSFDAQTEQQASLNVHEKLRRRDIPDSRLHSTSIQPSKNAARQTISLGNKPGNILTPGIIKDSKPVPPLPIPSAKKPEDIGGKPISAKGLSKEVLTPRQVLNPPVTFKARNSYLKLLHSEINKLNQQIVEGEAKSQGLQLSEDEIIHLVVGEEQNFAVTCGENIYQQTIGRRIKLLQKMALPDWIAFVIEKFKKTHLAHNPAPSSSKAEEQQIETGLTSAHEEIIILQQLRTPLNGLEGHGYITEPISDKKLEAARKGVESAAGFETCDRCGTRFQVFPGRNEQGRLTTGGECTHHWGKVVRSPKQKGANIVGRQDAYFGCCSKPMGIEGCTTADSHVFKVTDPARLGTVLQFEYTPDSGGKIKRKGPVTFDCEMAYTTLGLELVRLTAVSWPHGKELLDVLVRPFGEILDFNTRFSGVSKDQWAKANSYYKTPSDHGDDAPEEGEIGLEPLQKVDSPAAARQLLFDLLTPDTPLLGHAIDNDLNSCRIIHPFIVDTVLLFPHPKGLPIRVGLKMLSGRHLKRSIQQGGDQGHDSKEDAVATGDLVRLKVAEKWKEMKIEGWKFEHGELVPPEVE